MTRSIAIAGSLAQKPRQGGHTWQFLQYLLGFRRLGWQVTFVDRLEPEMCVNDQGQPCPVEDSVNLRYFREVMEQFGLADDVVVIYNRGERFYGLSRQQLHQRLRGSALLLNVMGFLDDEELLALAPRRVLLDTDPGFGQMWQDLGLATLFHGHDDYVTIAENIGRPECTIPTCGLPWITWRQPIVLDQWPKQEGAGGCATSIGSWRGPYAPIEYHGKTYGLRAHEFRKFATLPRHCQGCYQVALDIHSADAKDIELLTHNGWVLVDPQKVARNPLVYRRYIQMSQFEFMATKNIYVDTHSGWFSERSICYLASGRPVLAQDTGIKHLYPTGEGILTFSTFDEAVEGVRQLQGNYKRHARVARELAEEFFDSNKVLGDLLRKLGIA